MWLTMTNNDSDLLKGLAVAPSGSRRGWRSSDCRVHVGGRRLVHHRSWASCGATIASVTNGTTVVISAAATATATGVTITITTNYAIYDRLVDALTASQDAYADPKFWIINAQTIGVLRWLKDSQGHPLLSPDTTVHGAEQIVGRTVIPATSSAMPHGTAMLVERRAIYVAIDLTGYMRILLETYAANDQTGLLVVSRFDAGVTIPAGLVVIQGLGPN
jgi:HK97 family phage major capsid protein